MFRRFKIRHLKSSMGLGCFEGEGEGDPKGGGSGGGAKGEGGADPLKELEALRRENAALKEKIAKPKADPGQDDPELREKAHRERAASDRDAARTKRLEAALTFGLKSEEFLKNNASLLPKDVGDIFAQAQKENYSDAIEKDAAIKAGLVQSFFSVQANVDLLTPGLKAQLDDYSKLTKTGKQEKAQQIYESIFEPTFEMLKRLRKAEALQKGHGSGSDADTQYRNRMISLSRKHYLGEKHGS